MEFPKRIVAFIGRQKLTMEEIQREKDEDEDKKVKVDLPSVFAIKIPSKKKIETFKMSGMNDEFDFTFGMYPLEYRPATAEDNLGEFLKYQLKADIAKKDKEYPANLLFTKAVKKGKKETMVCTHVPIAFGGIQPGDLIVSCLGGSADLLNYCIADQPGVEVRCIKPFDLKKARGDGKKVDDHELLLETFAKQPELFRTLQTKDLEQIKFSDCFNAWCDAQSDRIAHGNKLYQRLYRQHCLARCHPNGDLEEMFEKLKNENNYFQAMVEEEEMQLKALDKLLAASPVYKQIFAPITGIGISIAARLIEVIRDIRRFEDDKNLRAYLGVHLVNGQFARKKKGALANWHNTGRQALYLAIDQFNRNPDSEWGQKLREYKANIRAAHPLVEVFIYKQVDGETIKELVGTYSPDEDRPEHLKDKKMKTRYTNGHIQKMAIWRCASKLSDHIFREWWKLEGGRKDINPVDQPIEEEKAA